MDVQYPAPETPPDSSPAVPGSVSYHECHHTKLPSTMHTCVHPYHSSYSTSNLPLLLFRLDAPPEPPRPALKTLIENGVVAEDHHHNPIKDFTFLPRYISTRVPGWLMEFWMRSDSRLGYRDLKARMTAAKEDLPSDNALNMRREREARFPLGLSCWTTRRGDITKTEVERVERWSQNQLSLNTTLEIEYAPIPGTNKIGPVCLLSRSLVDAPRCRYPLFIFLDGSHQPHSPGPRIRTAVDVLFQLQDAAMTHGVNDWRDLPKEYLPPSWTKRSVARTVTVDEPAGQLESQSMLPTHPRRVKAATKANNGYGKELVNSTVKRETEEEEEADNGSSAFYGRAEAERQTLGDLPLFPPADNEMTGITTSSQIFDKIAPRSDQSMSDDIAMVTDPALHNIPRLQNASPATPPKSAKASPSQNGRGRSAHFRLNFQDSPPEPVLQPKNPFGPSKSALKLPNFQFSPNSDSSYQVERSTPFGRQLTYDSPSDMEIEADGHHNNGRGDFHRFNGSGQFSVKNNPIHRVNINTCEIMQRNNPFINVQQPLMAAQRSFERFVMGDCD